MRLNKVKPIIFFWGTFILLTILIPATHAKSTPAGDDTETASLDEILRRVEKRYEGSGFSARFVQASTLKAMDITDSAFGKLYVKHPGMMRWEYHEPEPQTIVTDGRNLWIYRPEDNQVMVGKAPLYFGGGKGASFLSDMKVIGEKFKISLENARGKDYYLLKLLPKKNSQDIADLYLSVRKDTYDVAEIITYNPYGDETRIQLSQFRYNQSLDDSMFQFMIPEGVDVLQLEQ
jgi:outer membrane lipoprotein carrier protein